MRASRSKPGVWTDMAKGVANEWILVSINHMQKLYTTLKQRITLVHLTTLFAYVQEKEKRGIYASFLEFRTRSSVFGSTYLSAITL